jgi:hypothetical protein
MIAIDAFSLSLLDLQASVLLVPKYFLGPSGTCLTKSNSTPALFVLLTRHFRKRDCGVFVAHRKVISTD